MKSSKKKNLIQRLYRVSEEQDQAVKQKAKKHNGESAYIRHLIDKDSILR